MNNSVKSQAEKFTEAARLHGADDDETAFRAKLAVIARQKSEARSRGGDAFQWGLDAHAEGKDVSDSPYRDADPKSADWRAGWYAAEARSKE